MAGIGLRLHRLVSGGGYLRGATAYTASAVISAGPWITAVLALTLLNTTSAGFLNQREQELLFITITYAFGTSLIVTGALQMIVTRYLADRIYIEDTGAIAPTCAGVLLLAVPLLLLTVPFIVLAPFDLRYRLITSSLFVALSLIWMMMIFLSAARDYRRLVFIFLLAYAFGIVGAVGLGYRYGLLGTLGGFTLGQVVCLTLLVEQIFDEFGPVRRPQLAFLAYGRQYWDLALLGLCYNLAIWLDNIVYWLSPLGTIIGGFYRAYPAYDATKMLAHLATIPASAVFLVQLETHFYGHYRTFYRLIAQKGTFNQIAEARRGMIGAAKAGFLTIIKLQLAVTAGILLFAPDLAPVFGLMSAQIPILRVVALAASCQFLMLTAMLLLLYLDQRRAALAVVAFFALSNATFSLVAMQSGIYPNGVGYLLATILAAALSLLLLNDRLRRLEFLTFVPQVMIADEPVLAPTRPILTRPRLVVAIAAVVALVGLGISWWLWPTQLTAVSPPVGTAVAFEATVPTAMPILGASSSGAPTAAIDAPSAPPSAPAAVTAAQPITQSVPTATTVERPTAGRVLEQVAATEAALRSGQFEATIEYGDGSRSTVQLRFDIGGAQVLPRMYSSSNFQARTGSQSIEQVAIGSQTWQRQHGGRWQPVATQEGPLAQLQGYLPGARSIKDATIYEDNGRTVLQYHDLAHDADSQLTIESSTGRLLELRQQNRSTGLILMVSYQEWNRPVAITEPDLR